MDHRKDTPRGLCVEHRVLWGSLVTGGHSKPRETLGESWRRPWHPEDSSLARLLASPLTHSLRMLAKPQLSQPCCLPLWSPSASPTLRQHLDSELSFVPHPLQGCHQPTVMNSAGHHAKACVCGFEAELLRCEVGTHQ